jgi:hypothetical protein
VNSDPEKGCDPCVALFIFSAKARRQVVKTGFYQRDFGQTNEQQRHFNE